MITYPVDVDNTWWAVLDTSSGLLLPPPLSGERTTKNGVALRRWSRPDGGEIVGQDPNIVWLLYVDNDVPPYDSRLAQLVGTSVIDVNANTITTEWTPQERALEEQEQAAENEESAQFGRHFPVEKITLETAFVLGLLINFAIDGQAIPLKWRPYVLGYRDKVKDKLLPNRDRLAQIKADLVAHKADPQSVPLPDLTGWVEPNA